MVTQARLVDEANVALRAANRELDAFSYSVSHDLRAPLRAIDGFSRIALEDDTGQLTDSQHRYLGLVRENTQMMGQLIDDLLALARLSGQPLQRRQVSTAELVDDVRQELIAAQNGRRIEFRTGELPTVQADPVLLRQVFANLIDNALKYSRERDPAIVEVAGERRDGALVFRVSDNGVGFDMRYADKLFQVFQRLHRAEDYTGTGIGLANVHRIVTRHGGRVWAHAELGSGATFYFTVSRSES
jgi:light-regulated signal transduction histidine kinase (bacteriophytochrome)